MTFTYDLNTNGCLIIRANAQERKTLKELANGYGEFDYRAEADALESLLCNSKLDWIQPEEIGALTSAPILGFRDENGECTIAWAFMDYQVRSFVTDLIETGQVVFIS